MANDRQLWEGICRGDARSFETFYRENASRLQAFLRQLLRSEHAAEDVTQETFLQLWQRPNGFRPSGSLRAYLFGIGRKRAAEWWRQRSPTAERSGEQLEKPKGETLCVVADAFARLDVDLRSLLWLREVEGQSYAELAEIFDVPIGTVRSRLSAARQQLRRIWHASEP